jgi:chromosome segregation ATPase
MLLTAGSLMEFVRFLQITLVIILPILLISLAVPFIIQYRKKKKKTAPGNGDVVQKLIDATPDSLNYENEDADYVHYDQSGLVREYKSKLIYSHARYTALQRDYERVQDKCNALLLQMETPLLNKKNKVMEDFNVTNHAMDVNSLTALESERNELLTRLEQLNGSYQSLERENESLTTQLGLLTATDEERAVILNNWKEKSEALQDKIAEQDYLKDVLEEKNMQIGFLQQQLEQRIFKFHQSEKQFAEARLQLEQKSEETTNVQFLVNEKERLLSEKLNTITWLENSLQETRQQNEMMNAMVGDNNDKVLALQENLAREQSRLADTEQKLARNREMLRKLYRDIATCVEPEESPVFELKPAYVKTEMVELSEMIVL